MNTYQKAYADYLRDRVSQGLDLHPDGCIAFVAGYKAAQQASMQALDNIAYAVLETYNADGELDTVEGQELAALINGDKK